MTPKTRKLALLSVAGMIAINGALYGTLTHVFRPAVHKVSVDAVPVGAPKFRWKRIRTPDGAEPAKQTSVAATTARPLAPRPPAPQRVDPGEVPQSTAEAASSQGSPWEELDVVWSGEQVDGAWARSTQQNVDTKWRSLEVDGIELQSVDCRSTMCKLEFNQTEDGIGEDFAVRLPMMLQTFPQITSYVPHGTGKIVAFGTRGT